MDGEPGKGGISNQVARDPWLLEEICTPVSARQPLEVLHGLGQDADEVRIGPAFGQTARHGACGIIQAGHDPYSHASHEDAACGQFNPDRRPQFNLKSPPSGDNMGDNAAASHY